jgi:hypothetical protein
LGIQLEFAQENAELEPFIRIPILFWTFGRIACYDRVAGLLEGSI